MEENYALDEINGKKLVFEGYFGDRIHAMVTANGDGYTLHEGDNGEFCTSEHTRKSIEDYLINMVKGSLDNQTGKDI